MLTTQILLGGWTKPDDLERCLASLPRGCEILAGDSGASAAVSRLCRLHGVTTLKVSTDHGMDRCRNELLRQAKYDWNFFVEPWEELVQGSDEVLARVRERTPTEFVVISGDSLSRQVRLWDRREAVFVNPVYERVGVKGVPGSGVIVGAASDTLDRDHALADKWVSQSPTIPDPYYYRACVRLSRGEYQEFLRDAETYLFMEKAAVSSVVMTKYYVAHVHCYVLKDASKAIQSVSACLITKPLMAEFWCLLGDIHYHLLGRYDKADVFYRNAMFLGARRLALDPYPMEISKYDEYPRMMIDRIRTGRPTR